MKAYTDYPFTRLGDVAGEIAPIREVNVITYDGDKYCLIEVQGLQEKIKTGYLYKTHGRLNEVSCITPDHIV